MFCQLLVHLTELCQSTKHINIGWYKERIQWSLKKSTTHFGPQIEGLDIFRKISLETENDTSGITISSLTQTFG